MKLGPVFHPQAGGVEVVGAWEGTDFPALAVRKLGNWTSIYSATPMLSPTLVKNVCRLAGVRPVVEGADPSFVTRNFVALHAAVPHRERLRFASPTKVTDLLTGEVLGQQVRELEVEVPGPGTRLLRTER
jgi:hypothetical protein